LNASSVKLENRIASHVKKLMQNFLKHKETWLNFCSILKEFDCLISLSEVSFQSDDHLNMHRPVIESKGRYKKAFMKLEGSKHFTLALMNPNFVQNDIELGDPASISLLTGSNMAGKSTLMKQVCLIAIMGQIGCYVPCESAHFTVVDKIFSRIGASDRLNLGKSTFYIELEDMKHMVEQGTNSSLCIVDELGRGTSVSEGVAIASAFLSELSNMKLRCMFSTHLHNLLKFTRQDGNIKYQKMAILIGEDNELNFVHKL
jgi:DNA mismatch repair protein MSH6